MSANSINLKVYSMIFFFLISATSLFSFISNNVQNVLDRLETMTNYENITLIENSRYNNSDLTEEEKGLLNFISGILYYKMNSTDKGEYKLLESFKTDGNIMQDYAGLILTQNYIKRKNFNRAQYITETMLRKKNLDTLLKVEYFLCLIKISDKRGERIPISYYEEIVSEIKKDGFLLSEYKEYLPEYEYKIAEENLKKKSVYESFIYLRNIMYNYPGSNYSLKSVQTLDRLLSNAPWLKKYTTEDLYKNMVKIYIKNKSYNSALKMLKYLPKSKENYISIFDCYLKDGQYSKAKKILEELKGTREYYLKLAQMLKQKNNYKDSKEILEKILQENIQDDVRETSLVMMVEILLNERRYSLAIKYYDELINNYPANKYLEECLYILGKGYFENQNFFEAEKYFSKLTDYLQARQRESEDIAKSIFLTGICREKQGRLGDAAKTYCNIIKEYPCSYYTYRALERLKGCYKELAKYERAEDGQLNEIYQLKQKLRNYYLKGRTDTYYTNYGGAKRYYEYDIREISDFNNFDEDLKNHFIKYFTLKRLGYYDYAVFELKYIYSKNNDENIKYNIALIYSKNSQYNKAINLIENLMFNSNNYEFNLSNFPAEIKDILYPMYWYKDLIEKYSLYYNLNPLLIRALIREESRFNFMGKSGVGASGLMQIMPATGKWIAKRIGQMYFKPTQLYNPTVNINFGTYYLCELLEKYNNDIIKALAAYNGGGGNVDKWIKNLKVQDIDYFVEVIPFSETKNYVKKVLKSFYLYSLMYKSIDNMDFTFNNSRMSYENYNRYYME